MITMDLTLIPDYPSIRSNRCGWITIPEEVGKKILEFDTQFQILGFAWAADSPNVIAVHMRDKETS